MQPLVQAACDLIQRETQTAGLTYNIEFQDISTIHKLHKM